MKTIKHNVTVNGRTTERHSKGTPAYLKNINVEGGVMTVHGADEAPQMAYSNGQKFWSYGNRNVGKPHHGIAQAALRGRNPQGVILPAAAKINQTYQYGNVTAGTIQGFGDALINHTPGAVDALADYTAFQNNGQKNINTHTSSNQFAGRGQIRMLGKNRRVIFDQAMENEMLPGDDFEMEEERFIDEQMFKHNAPHYQDYFNAADAFEGANAINNVGKIKNNRK